MRVCFLIPTLNEAAGIQRTLDSIPRQALQAAGYEVSALVIDGDSVDGTPELAEQWGAKVIQERRKGYGRAYKTGFGAADADWIVTGDADGTYPFDHAVAYLRDVRRRRLDFATFDRYARMEAGAMRWLHRVGNWGLSFWARRLFGVHLRDSQSGMWILSRAAVGRLPLDSLSDSMAFSQEIKVEALLSDHIQAKELSGGYRPRLGDAKLDSWTDGVGNLRELFRYRRRRRDHA